MNRTIPVANFCAPGRDKYLAVLEGPLFLDIHQTQDDVVLKLRRNLLPIHVRDIARDSLTGCARRSVIDLRDELIQLPQKQRDCFNHHDDGFSLPQRARACLDSMQRAYTCAVLGHTHDPALQRADASMCPFPHRSQVTTLQVNAHRACAPDVQGIELSERAGRVTSRQGQRLAAKVRTREPCHPVL